MSKIVVVKINKKQEADSFKISANMPYIYMLQTN